MGISKWFLVQTLMLNLTQLDDACCTIMSVGKGTLILKGFSQINVNCLTPKRSKIVVILLPHRTVLIANGFDIFNTLSENMSNKMSASLR